MRRATAANTVFLNQHESGSFPRFLDGGSPRYGMPAHLSVDFEADSAAIEANRRTYGVAWPSLSFQDAKLIVSFGADFLEAWGASVPQQLDFADARAKLAGAPRFIYIGPRRYGRNRSCTPAVNRRGLESRCLATERVIDSRPQTPSVAG